MLDRLAIIQIAQRAGFTVKETRREARSRLARVVEMGRVELSNRLFQVAWLLSRLASQALDV